MKLALEEEGVERGTPFALPTGGPPMKVIVCSPPSQPSPVDETKPVFSLEDARNLKRKRGFSHDDMAED